MPSIGPFTSSGNVAAGAAEVMRAQGSAVPISLLELQLTNGKRMFFSDQNISAVSALSAFDAATTTVTPPSTGVLYPTTVTNAGTSNVRNPALAYDGSMATFATLGDGAGTLAAVSVTTTAVTGGVSVTGITLGSGGSGYTSPTAQLMGKIGHLPATQSLAVSSSGGVITAVSGFNSTTVWDAPPMVHFDGLGGGGVDATFAGWAASTLGAGAVLYVVAQIDSSASLLSVTIAGSTTSLSLSGNGIQAFSLALPTGTDPSTVSVRMRALTGMALLYEVYIATVGTPTVTTTTVDSVVPFQAWLIDPPQWACGGNLVTQTATCTFQNLSGDTVMRDNTKSFSKQDLWGALAIYRLYKTVAEIDLFKQVAYVTDAAVDDKQMTLTLSSWLDFSKIAAPNCEINNSCQNTFGSQQCGSTSTVRCLNSYGNCSQLNRFKGLITQWNTGVYNISTNSGIAQPIPQTSFNSRGVA